MKKLRDKLVSPARTSQISFVSNKNRMKNPSGLCFTLQKQPTDRLVIPKSKRQNPLNSNNKFSIQSMNVSRQHIQDDFTTKGQNIQFSKTTKNNLKINHHRSKSNQVCIEDDMSNFSNSLQNISQEVIEIPFKKKVIEYRNKENQKNNQNLRLQFTKKNGSLSREKRKSRERKNGSVDLNKQQKQQYLLRKSQLLTHRKQFSQSGGFSFIPPRPKPKTSGFGLKLSISQFSLKAQKISAQGSIIYLAMHKKSGSVYSIKSIRKQSARNRMQEVVLQIKIGLVFGHPNFAKIYGFFSDHQNIYIIKEYLQEGCIVQSRKQMNTAESLLTSQSLNQVLFAASCLCDFINIRKWSFSPPKIAKSHGIAKLTGINLKDNNNPHSTTDEIRQTIEWFFDQDDRRETIDGTLASNHSKMLNNPSFLSKNSNSFLQTLGTISTLDQNTLFLLLEHPYLRDFRFKATMLE